MAVIGVRDVAASAGVSVGTVSNVLNSPGKVSAGTVKRVQAAITKLGFVRNDAARQLRAGRSIGLVVLDVANPFFSDAARGAEERAAEQGLAVLLGNSDENIDRESAYLDLFEEQRVLGVLISPLGDVGGGWPACEPEELPPFLSTVKQTIKTFRPWPSTMLLVDTLP